MAGRRSREGGIGGEEVGQGKRFFNSVLAI